jgi:SAM-dependent methyltransferase
MKPYRWLAQYYDEIFEPARSGLDAAREQLLFRILPRVGSACDLACGTGTTALKHARRGIHMYAVDLSPLMCRIARQKAARAGLPLRVLRGDMRRFRLPEQVDLITCECDALNHLPRKSDLRLVVKAVARALHPGGHFYFDVNHAQGFRRYWSGNVCVEKPGVVVVMRNGHSPEADKAWSDIDWFIREGNCWRRRRERVEEVCWDGAEIRGLLEQAGFDHVQTWDGARFFVDNPTMGRGSRTIFLARKLRD